MRDTGVETKGIVMFDNILPGPACDSAGHEYNPTWKELLPVLDKHRIWSLGPKSIVVGLSAQVCRALTEARKTRICDRKNSIPFFIFMAHPSFIMRRNEAERYGYFKELEKSLKAAVCCEVNN